MKEHYAYQLERNGLVFYVGSTVNPKSRLIAHKSKYGGDIEMKIVGTHFDSSISLNEEMALISKYRDEGVELTNGVVGRPRVKDRRISVTICLRQSMIVEGSKRAALEGKTLRQKLQEFLHEIAES